MGGGAESSVVVEAEPSATFKVVQAQLAFEFLIVSLDSPAQLDQSHEFPRWRIDRHVAQVELKRPLGLVGLLNEQPLLWFRWASFLFGRADSKSRETRALRASRALSPRNVPKACPFHELLGGDRRAGPITKACRIRADPFVLGQRWL